MRDKLVWARVYLDLALNICEIAEPSSRGGTTWSLLIYLDSLPHDSEDYHNISEIITMLCEE